MNPSVIKCNYTFQANQFKVEFTKKTGFIEMYFKYVELS